MKKLMSILFLIFLVGCSSQRENGQLTRIDVQNVHEEDIIMTDRDTIKLLETTFAKIKWEPRTKADMARKEDVKATFFYMFNNNMPKRLYEYRIWFNPNKTATIISNHEEEGYGTLHAESAQVVKEALLKAMID